MDIFETFIYAFFVGLLPALVWLWFWLHEDKKHPEPRSILAFTFLAGMAMVFLAIPLEGMFARCAQNAGSLCLPINLPLSQSWQFLAWAAVEEILKLGAAFLIAFRAKAYDEPLDAIIYMMCAALGFAALENTLFILNNSASVASSISTGISSTIFLTNLRFIGANLLHVVASSTIGIALAFSFYKTKSLKVVWLIGGLTVAVILHTLFNLFIIDGSPGSILLTFMTIWLTMIAFALMFEKIKKISN